MSLASPHWRQLLGWLMSLALAAVIYSGCSETVDEDASIDESSQEEALGESEAYLIAPHGERLRISYEMVDGVPVMEGDILLDPDQLEFDSQFDPQERIEGQQALAGIARSRLWPGGVIPYVVSGNIPNRGRITQAIRYVNSKTKLKLVPRKGQKAYVKFIYDSASCSSSIGRTGSAQVIKISNWCSWGLVVHEIGHAAGLFHTQSRMDRDKYVTVKWNNIQRSAQRNFLKYRSKGYDGRDIGPYETGSIMHYPSYNNFALNKKYPTITRKNGSTFGQNTTHMTANDIRSLGKLYHFVKGKQRDCKSNTLRRSVVHGACVQMDYKSGCGSKCAWAACSNGNWVCKKGPKCAKGRGKNHPHKACGATTKPTPKPTPKPKPQAQAQSPSPGRTRRSAPPPRSGARSGTAAACRCPTSRAAAASAPGPRAATASGSAERVPSGAWGSGNNHPHKSCK